MFKNLRYRIYPTKVQVGLVDKHISCSRFIYNLGLEYKVLIYKEFGKSLNYYDLNKELPLLKKDNIWLKEVNSQTLQESLRNLEKSYVGFFKGVSNFPKFKKKSSGGSFNIPQQVFIKDGKLIIPKFREGIKISLHRPVEGTIKRATISKTPTGKYFVSILCDTKEELPTKLPVKESTTVGIDLGIKDFAITSNGEIFENPKYLKKAQSKIRYVQRKCSKYKGKRTKKKLAQLHEDVANKRKDFLHKVSTKLIRENQTICLETLSVKNMVKNHNLAQAISDASWSTFVNMLEYKADWYGKNILKIDRFAPSSKTCSSCGYINKELTLKDRSWTCPKCSSVLDRDVNAAINIKAFALKENLSGEHRLKNQDELPALAGVMTPETWLSKVR